MTSTRQPSALSLFIQVWILLLLVGQSSVDAQDSDALDLVKDRFGSSSAVANAVHHHGLGDHSQSLFLVTWELSDESKSYRVGQATTSGTFGTYRHRFDWSTTLTGHKDLAASDIGIIRDALFDLPVSEIPECLEDVVVFSYWKHNRWTHRVYDLRSPPPGLKAIVTMVGMPALVVGDHAPN